MDRNPFERRGVQLALALLVFAVVAIFITDEPGWRIVLAGVLFYAVQLVWPLIFGRKVNERRGR